MNELDRIIDQLQRAHNGDAWHGDPLMKILHGVTAEHSGVIWLPETHTFHQIVVHITTWQREASRRLTKRNYRELTPDQDWVPTSTSVPPWESALEELNRSHAELVSAISEFDPALLDSVIPNSPNQTYYVLLQGVIQHTLYHAGQIAILKKAFLEVPPGTYPGFLNPEISPDHKS